MYRENSVEHTPRRICMYRLHHVSVCEKTVSGGKRFLYRCLCASGLRASFDGAPAGGFLVRRPRVYEAGSQGMNVKAREAAPKGMALTECSLPAPMRV